jgi:hypothetical protein
VLHQYWVTVTPSRDTEEIAALSASAYIVLPESREPPSAPPVVAGTATESRTPPPISIPNAGKDSLIGPLEISAPRSRSDCGMGACSILKTEARVDSIVFFLEHQANHGLVRLSDSECRNRTAVRVARSGQSLQFPIARTTTSSRDWSETYEWNTAPDLDTYYAVVVTDAKLARRMANHMDRLPMRCTDALRPGLEDDELRAWLNDFAMLTAALRNMSTGAPLKSGTSCRRESC